MTSSRKAFRVLLVLGATATLSTHAFLWSVSPLTSSSLPVLHRQHSTLRTTPTTALALSQQQQQEGEQQYEVTTTLLAARRRSSSGVDRRAIISTGTGLVAASWLLSAPDRAEAAAAATATATAPKAANALCDDAISHLRNPKTGQEIYMIGTAHISNTSALLVRSTIRELRPQTVMLELDASRIGRISNPSPPADGGGTTPTPPPAPSTTSSGLPPAKFISPPPPPGSPRPSSDAPVLVPKEAGKQGFLKAVLGELTRAGSSLRERLVGVGAVVVGQVISGLYKGLDKMGFVSGQEFIVAIEEGRRVGADLLLGDRDVQVTLRRLSDALSRSELVKIREMESPTRNPAARELEARGIKIGSDPADISVAVEALKERASVRALMGTLKSELPEVYKAMIEERDAYMAASLLGCPSKVIVGVVGMGHLDGIERNLGEKGFVLVPCRLESRHR